MDRGNEKERHYLDEYDLLKRYRKIGLNESAGYLHALS